MKEENDRIVSRILTFVDRDPKSITYGCCDRQYWHYKTIDFPNTRMQEAALSLVIVCKNDSRYKNEKMLKIIESILNFWAYIQNRNGSFSEALPKENSFITTAFSSDAVLETIKILNIKSEKLISALEKASRWLLYRNDLEVSNHQAGTVKFLYSMYELTGKNEYKKASEEKLRKLLDTQSTEGWFPEYGGPDAGYLSLTINYLSSYYDMSKDNSVIEPIKKASEYLSHFFYPDGSFGGEVFSRNSELFFSAGQNLNNLDDRYFVWLSSLTKKLNTKPKNNFEKYFEESGIFVHSDKENYVICNLKKGGAIKIFKKGKEIYSDCGLVGKHNRHVLTNCLYGDYKIKFENNTSEISGYMYKFKPMKLSPMKNSLIRLLASLGFSDLIIRKAKDNLIRKRKQTKIRFERKIDFSNIENVNITDKTFGNDNIVFEKAKRAPYTYTASSGFSKPNDF